MADTKKKNTIKYSEPAGYMPKKYWDEEKPKKAKPTVKKTTKKG